MKKFILQWVILTAIILWGFASFLVLSGEDTEDTTLSQFFIVKGLALISFIACCLTARWCDKKNLLPNVPEE